MEQNNRVIQVTGRDGLLGWVDLTEQPDDKGAVLVRLSNGQGVLVPADLLQKRTDGSYFLPLEAGQFDPQREPAPGREEMMVIPLAAEEAVVGKRLVRNRVRVTKRVREREERIDSAGYSEEVEIERVPVNEVVDEPPLVREEGDTTIIPLLEEVLVVEKRILLKEEVRVTRRRRDNEPRTVRLRYEEVEVEREQNGSSQEPGSP
jgi:stress response protein YsnF